MDIGLARSASIDWARALRAIERRRRQVARAGLSFTAPRPRAHLAAATYSSFRIDGLDLSMVEVNSALSHGAQRKVLRSRQGQRIRNHVAILHCIAKSIRQNEPLRTTAVVRWYTSISNGLSTACLNDSTMSRLNGIVRQVNSPQLRLQPALQEIARLHGQLLADPFVPSFNGILARLLLTYHLGRCALPAVVFHPESPPTLLQSESHLLPYLLGLIDESYLLLLAGQSPESA